MAIIPSGDYMAEVQAQEGDEIYFKVQAYFSIINI